MHSLVLNPLNKSEEENKQYAFISFEKSQSAEKAISCMNKIGYLEEGLKVYLYIYLLFYLKGETLDA